MQSTSPTVHRIKQGKKNEKHTTAPSTISCYRCGGSHYANKCSFVDAVCHSCSKKGHISKVCRSKSKLPPPTKPKSKPATTRHVSDRSPSPSPSPPPANEDSYTLFSVRGQRKSITLSIKLLGKEVPMELDTGAAFSIIGEPTFHSVFGENYQLEPTNITLRLYGGQDLPVLGSVNIHVQYEGQSEVLPLLVVKGPGVSLFGRNWLEKLQVNWQAIHSVQGDSAVRQLLQRHTTLFRDEVGRLEGFKAKIYMPENAQPHFFKSCRVQYYLKDKVDAELERLQKEGIITPVKFSEWAAPIVPVLKSNGQVRICGDYKITVNQVAKFDMYPLPLVEDLLTTLSGASCFQNWISLIRTKWNLMRSHIN